MPEKGKKADLMFVQHMLAVLKADGKMATIMPHGVLFRGGEESEARATFIERRLARGRHRSARRPVLRHRHSGLRAGDEQEGRRHPRSTSSSSTPTANTARARRRTSCGPKTSRRSSTSIARRQDVPSYARRVPVSEIGAEDYNCNIRRYVDNAPPPEPHDVRAHLHGGVPVAEIDHLAGYFANYEGVKSLLFRDRDTRYSDFATAVMGKDGIKSAIETASGLQAKHAAFHKAIAGWWKKNVAEIERLPETKNVFELRRHCIDSLAKALTPQGILTSHQVRGAVASYIKSLESDLKSVAASGWGAELIPEEQILQSQFPEVLAQIEEDQTRIAELEGLFAAANESENEDTDLENVDTENGVLPKALVKAIKDEREALAGEVKGIKKLVKERRLDAKRTERTGSLFGNRNEILTEATDTEEEGLVKWQRIQEIDEQLAGHSALEGELKKLKANIREVEKQKDALIASARAKISEDDAKRLILERFQRLLTAQFDGYLRQYQRAFIAAVENLWSKYAVITKQILAERDQAAAQLNQFMKELGYE